MSKKFAAFDIDGTLFHWQLFHELFDEFSDQKLINATSTATVMNAREDWHIGKISWDDYEIQLIEALNAAIIGIDATVLDNMAERIITSKGKTLYRYTSNLLQELKADGYTTIVISGSHQPLVEKFATQYGVDIAIGLHHETIDGKISANRREVYGKKGELLEQIVHTNQLDWVDSYAIGDSMGDLAMLELVEHPIAFNPDEKLLAIAKEKGWKIVVERKSIAYSLEKGSDGTYILA